MALREDMLHAEGLKAQLLGQQAQGFYTPPNRGWECPKCGSVWAPFVPGCARCDAQKTQAAQRAPQVAPSEWARRADDALCLALSRYPMEAELRKELNHVLCLIREVAPL